MVSLTNMGCSGQMNWKTRRVMRRKCRAVSFSSWRGQAGEAGCLKRIQGMARPLLMYHATMKRLNLTGCPVSPGVSRLQRLQPVPSVDVAYSSAAGEVVSG